MHITLTLTQKVLRIPKLCLFMLTSKEESDQVRYKQDGQSTRVIRLLHQYFITNKGPSYLPMTYVNITVPVKEGMFEIDTAVSALLPLYLYFNISFIQYIWFNFESTFSDNDQLSSTVVVE